MAADLRSGRRYVWVVLALAMVTAAARAAESQFTVLMPVANMYSAPTQDADVVSQAIYGTTVGVVEEQGEWVKVRTPGDDYTGWVTRSALTAAANPPYASSGKTVEVRNLAAHIYRETDVTKHAPLLTVPFETRLEVVSEAPNSERWLQVRLVDGQLAWIQQGDIRAEQKRLTIAETIALSRHFLGLPYTWGGRSSFGYDCSGFVQMLMRQRGYSIPRDAQPQAEWSGFRAVARNQLRPGDLLYFGKPGDITHTGMYIGHGLFINATTHERPVLQIGPLNDPYWTRLLVAQRRVK